MHHYPTACVLNVVILHIEPCWGGRLEEDAVRLPLCGRIRCDGNIVADDQVGTCGLCFDQAAGTADVRVFNNDGLGGHYRDYRCLGIVALPVAGVSTPSGDDNRLAPLDVAKSAGSSNRGLVALVAAGDSRR